ncbi:ABC transporter substrate-binding protein [Haladaptatus sp. DYF46]|uniref:ABC transporter substrate-binding protein n=1 Tax=Haladaptatus sp. DYF46 TaxID=2886041 RepID=UPI001E4A4DB4|nr:ABC transporter substrate-binding protein [Haladaptatus sp. DYF46]
MVRENNRHRGPTRRDYVKYGGVAIGGGLLAGCTDDSQSESAATETTGDSPATTTPEDGSYSVTIEPAGEVKFESVPKTWAAAGGAWVDMGVALGVEDGIVSLGSYPAPQMFYEGYDVSLNRDSDVSYWRDGGYDKEIFYELDADIHFLDPIGIQQWDENWDEEDIEEISTAVGPVCGNNCRRRREFRREYDYPLYPLYEAFEKVAAVFQREERYRAFAELHEEVMADVKARIPSEGDRTAIGLINGGSNPQEGVFYPMDVVADGYEMKTYRDLGAVSAFKNTDASGSDADYEYLLEVDPEVIIVHWGIGGTSEHGATFDHETFAEQWLKPMGNHPVGKQLTAVKEERILPGAWGEQGPIVNLFQTELTAQQLYPDEFGAFDPERYPDLPADERLFDRQRVADIINGDVRA